MSTFKTEEEALQHYDSSQYRTPDGYTSDIAIFTLIPNEGLTVEGESISNHSLALMLIKRA
jgi:8-oxo-dGTP diphosphatase